MAIKVSKPEINVREELAALKTDAQLGDDLGAKEINELSDATTQGSSNVGLGEGALSSPLLTGGSNTATGVNALNINTEGADNTATGVRALLDNTTGSFNTANGLSALRNNTEGDSNTAAGYVALYSNTTGIRNTATGQTALYSNTTGRYNTANGQDALYSNTGSNNSSLGSSSLNTNTSGSNNTGLGFNAQGSSATASNQVTLGDANVTSLRCNVTTITALSDSRDKTEIVDSPYGIDFINSLNPRQFKWDTRAGNIKDGMTHLGFIAQELQDSMDATAGGNDVLDLIMDDNPERLEVKAGNLLPTIVQSIKDLSTTEGGTRTDINVNRNNIIELEEQIEFLTPSVDRGNWEYDESTVAPREPASKGYYLTNAVSTRVHTFAEADIILFSNTDANGGSHTFSDVSVGEWLEVFETGDADFLLAQVKSVNLEENHSWFEIDVVKAIGSPTLAAQGGVGIRVKFFTLTEAEIDLDSYAQTSYVNAQDAKKLDLTGGTVNGTVTATAFVGDGSGLTGMPAVNLAPYAKTSYVDDKDAKKLNLSGGTVTGDTNFTGGLKSQGFTVATKVSLAAVATSGSYNDLSNKPATGVELGTSSGPPNGKAKGTLYLTTTGKLYIYTS